MSHDLDKPTLQHLLRLAAAGDEDAWRRIIEAYTPRVFGLIRSQCGDAVLAEEITQSTFCTIVTKIESYTEVGKFEPWLFRIAVNRLRDEMRRRKRQARPVEGGTLIGLAGQDAASAGGSSSDCGPAGGGLEAAELHALREAIGKLSDADQRILHLRHFGELSFKQIAEALDQPLGTVLARHHRALKKLADLLGGGNGTPK